MDVPMEISFRGVDKDESIEDLIRRKAGKLEQVCDHITSLRVAVEQDQKHQASGNPYRVRLDINVPPGHEFVIKRETTGGHVHSDIPMIVRDAFDAARRKLKKINEKQQGKVKSHPMQASNAVVARLFPEEDYGFLKSIDGRDVYFHRNSLVDHGLEELKPGDGVTFSAELGDKGLQATSVHVVDRPSE